MNHYTKEDVLRLQRKRMWNLSGFSLRIFREC